MSGDEPDAAYRTALAGRRAIAAGPGRYADGAVPKDMERDHDVDPPPSARQRLLYSYNHGRTRRWHRVSGKQERLNAETGKWERVENGKRG